MSDALFYRNDLCTRLIAVVPLSAMLLAGLLFVGSSKAEISEVENRKLAEWPEFSAQQLWSGKWTGGIELYVADRFLARDLLMNIGFGVQDAISLQLDRPRYFAVLDDDQGGLDRADEWGVRDDEIDEPDENQASYKQNSASGYSDDGDNDLGSHSNELTAQLDEDEDAPEPQQKTKKSGKAHTENGILIIDARAFQLFGGQPKYGERYAEIINHYHDVLPETTRIFSIIAPTSVSFYLPPDQGKRSHSEREFVEALYKAHIPEVHSVDLFPLFDAHKDEFLYFRTDHHWTGRAAYYAYVAYCRAAGIDAVPLEQMERKVKDNFVGSMYGYTKSKDLKDNPEYVEYFVPPGTDTVKAYDWENPNSFIESHLLRENRAGYGVFLGGDHPLIDAHTSTQNGKTVLVVKNSYGNPFVPYLRAHYENILVVDYRYYKGTLSKLVAERGVNDVIFINVTTSAGSTFHRGRLKKLMGKKVTTIPTP